jgi:hypothetical protein
VLARSGYAAAGISTSITLQRAARGRPAAICSVPLTRLPVVHIGSGQARGRYAQPLRSAAAARQFAIREKNLHHRAQTAPAGNCRGATRWRHSQLRPS